MSRTAQIDTIIATRRQQANSINSRYTAISDIRNALRDLGKSCSDLQSKLQNNANGCEALGRVLPHIDKASSQVRDLLAELKILKNRTRRDTLNIGIIGLAKQGKSTFLKSLTGLEEAIIPTGGSYVTGACSYLCHDENVQPGQEYAIITYYSNEEFLSEVLKPFCKTFGLVISSVDELPLLRLPEENALPQTQKVMLERLKGLKEHYNDYRDLLGTAPARKPKSEIRRYVAKHAEDNVTEYFNWYAVKKAEIHCRFLQDDIGKIMICDTPGQKDFTPGAEEALTKRLSKDMDIVFFMTKRDPISDEVGEDYTNFHGMVEKAVPQFRVDEWAYLLLNCLGGSTPSAHLLDNLRSKVPTRLTPQPLDASSTEAVKNTFGTILHDIVGQIPVLDARLLDSYNKKYANLKQTLQELTQAARRTIQSISNEDMEDDEARHIINQLYVRLKTYRNTLSVDSQDLLAPAIAAIIRKLAESEPQLSYDELNTDNIGTWCDNMKNQLRAEFIKQFSQLDDVMDDIVVNARNELKKILIEDDGGRLGFVTGGEDTANFWEELKATLAETLGESRSEHLCLAIDNVLNIKLHFRSFILPRLTEITNGLSNAQQDVNSPFAAFAYTSGDSIEDCRNKLLSVWHYVIGRSEEMFDVNDGELKDVNYTPAAAMRAMVDEFILLWYNHQGNQKAEDILKSFYKRHNDDVWPEKKKADSTHYLSLCWSQAVRDFAQKTNKLN